MDFTSLTEVRLAPVPATSTTRTTKRPTPWLRTNSKPRLWPSETEKSVSLLPSLLLSSPSLLFLLQLIHSLEIVNFGDTMLNTPVAGYKGHQKTPSGSGNSMLNTTAPICITSLNQGGVGSPASHSRTPSMTNDPSRNRKIHEGGPNCPATSSAYSGSKRDNSYLKGAAIGEKLQKYAASRPQTGKRGGSSQNLTTDSSNQNLRNKWIRYSSGGAASSSKVSYAFILKLGAAGSHGNLNTTMNYNSSSYIRQPGLSNKQAAATKYFSPPQRQTHAYHQINNFVVSPQDPN